MGVGPEDAAQIHEQSVQDDAIPFDREVRVAVDEERLLREDLREIDDAAAARNHHLVSCEARARWPYECARFSFGVG